jgi:hypothetical protein
LIYGRVAEGSLRYALGGHSFPATLLVWELVMGTVSVIGKKITKKEFDMLLWTFASADFHLFHAHERKWNPKSPMYRAAVKDLENAKSALYKAAGITE